MASTSDVTEALKYRYGVDEVKYLFEDESVTWEILSKRKKPMGGRGQWLVPILTQNPTGFTGITEGGTLPSALQPATTEATFSLQEYVGLYNVSWKLIQDARTDEFAFERAVMMLEDGLKRHIMRMLNADLLSDGRGVLAKLPAADDQTTVTVDRYPSTHDGMVVDVMDTDNDTKHGDSLTVNSHDVANKTITLSGAPSGTAANDYIVIQDTCDDSLNDSLHSHGLLDIFDDADPAAVVGNYGNIDRDTYPFWQASVLSNSGTNRPIDEDLLIQAEDLARAKGKGEIDVWMSNMEIIRQYHQLLSTDRFYSTSIGEKMSGGVGRKDGGTKPKKDGKTTYDFSGKPWHVDIHFEPNTILGLPLKNLWIGHGENDVPRPISEIFDDIPFFRQTSSATFEVAWYYQMQLLCDCPNAGVKIEDVAES